MNKDVKDVGKSVASNVTSHAIKKGCGGCFGCGLLTGLLIVGMSVAAVAMGLR